jgi:hypothetical protein
MPQLETWPRLPIAIRDHLVERMHDRNIRLEDLNQLRICSKLCTRRDIFADYQETSRLFPHFGLSAPDGCRGI